MDLTYVALAFWYGSKSQLQSEFCSNNLPSSTTHSFPECNYNRPINEEEETDSGAHNSFELIN